MPALFLCEELWIFLFDPANPRISHTITETNDPHVRVGVVHAVTLHRVFDLYQGAKREHLQFTGDPRRLYGIPTQDPFIISQADTDAWQNKIG